MTVLRTASIGAPRVRSVSSGAPRVSGAIRSGGDVLIVRIASWADIPKAHPENVMAPIKLGTAISLMELSGHRVTLIDGETHAFTREDVLRAFRTGRPDIVILHGITTAVRSVNELGQAARDLLPGALIVASGQHATARPGDFFKDRGVFDACAQYEYEEALAELVDARAAGASLSTVPGLSLPGATPGEAISTGPRPLREDLDHLPFPKHALFMRPEYTVFHPTNVVRRRQWGFLMSSRGCPYPCLYCSPTLRNSYGRKMRYRSIENVGEEVALLERLGATVLHFKDDIFTMDKERTHALCDELIRRRVKLSWTVQTRADCVDDALLKHMKAAGCCTVSMGIESGSPRILEVLRKKETVEDAISAADAARRAGLFLVNFYLLANPTETLAEMEATLTLAKRLDPDLLQVGFFTPYPGSPYYEETFRESDTLSPEEFSHYNRIINVSAVPTEQLYEFQKRFYREMIFRPSFALRFARQRLASLPFNFDHEARFYGLSAKFLLKKLAFSGERARAA